MSVTAIYSTEAFHKTIDFPGKHSEPFSFPSLKDAQAAPLPEGYAFAVIQDDETGYHTYSDKLGWEFHGKL